MITGDSFPLIHPAPHRETVQVTLPDGTTLEGPRGAPLGDFLKAARPDDSQVVAGVLNGALRELTYPVTSEAAVRPVTMAHSDGMLIYRRSLTFLLAAAAEELFPEARLTIDHSVSAGGYFCRASGREPFSAQELACLEKRMFELAAEDLPFEKEQIPLKEAIEFFRARGYADKVRLLAHRKKDYLVLYRLRDYRDYHHGYMVPSTGYLKWFALAPVNGGFTLRFPRRQKPDELQPPPEFPKLLATFREYGDWLERLGIGGVGALNDSILSGRIREIILVAEAFHERKITYIAEQIARDSERIKLVLIAGPSAAGKTTFSKRLTIQLLAHGLQPLALELDNYFVDRDKTPLDEQGQVDYEILEALDRMRLNRNLLDLMTSKGVTLPRYNFKTGMGEEGENVRLRPDQMILLEGIHGLHPDLLTGFPPEQIFRIYVSALTQLNLDRHNRVSTTDTRLVRRIVRDAAQRGNTAADTIRRWPSVRRGEKRHIFPYQENAEAIFNSALVYELSVLRPLADPLLRQVPAGTDEHIEAKRLLALLEWFLPCEADSVPDDSLLREFVGDSILKDFKLWGSP